MNRLLCLPSEIHKDPNPLPLPPKCWENWRKFIWSHGMEFLEERCFEFLSSRAGCTWCSMSTNIWVFFFLFLVLACCFDCYCCTWRIQHKRTLKQWCPLWKRKSLYCKSGLVLHSLLGGYCKYWEKKKRKKKPCTNQIKNKQNKLYFILLVLRNVSLAEISCMLQTNTECKP